MTPAIFQEITAPIDYGYEYPYTIIKTIRTVQMNEEWYFIMKFLKIKNWEEVNVKLLHIALIPLQLSLQMIGKPGRSHLNTELL